MRTFAAPTVSQPPVALYVHVPFCVSLCPYCDFVVFAGAAAHGPAARVASFVDALSAELVLRADALDTRFGPPGSVTEGAMRLPLVSVYLGGGTPTLLPGEAIAALLDLVRRRYGVAPGAEVTIEANPGPDERGDARELAAAGVNRISIGAQSFESGLLKRLGRRHRAEDIGAAVGAARAAGIDSVSLDLLYDVPGQTLDDWSATLDRALALSPDHVSAYALTLDDPEAEGLAGPLGDHLPTRSGARRWRVDARRDQDEDRAAAQYERAVERLAAAGFAGYEISNWCRPGHASRHNLAYWHRRPHEAVGPGAHAFDGVTRRWNAASLDGYLAALLPLVGPPRLPPGASSPAGDGLSEAAILALRLDEGLTLEEARGGPLAPHLAWAIGSGLMEEVPSPVPRVHLTTRGRLLSNELFARLV